MLVLPAGQRHSCEQGAGGVVSGTNKFSGCQPSPSSEAPRRDPGISLDPNYISSEAQSVCLGAQKAFWPSSAVCRVPERRGTDHSQAQDGSSTPLMIPLPLL